MKANELRIGNLVTVDNEKCHPYLKDVPLCVFGEYPRPDENNIPTHSIELRHINLVPNKYYQTYSQFLRFVKPIPLTKEWLDKIPPKIKGCVIYVHCHFADETIWFLHIGNEFAVSIKYVHQLQNLLFALTGEELGLQSTLIIDEATLDGIDMDELLEEFKRMPLVIRKSTKN